MKLTIISRTKDVFGVIVNESEKHKSRSSIFNVTLSDNQLYELTDNKEDKGKLIEFAFEFLFKHKKSSEIPKAFEIASIEQTFPEFPDLVKEWANRK